MAPNAVALIEVAKQQMRIGNYRAAQQALHRANQSQPTAQEEFEIEILSLHLSRTQR